MNFQMPEMPEIPDPPTWAERNDIDSKLMALVSVVENSTTGTSFGITLSVSGAVVTGDLSSHGAWVEHMRSAAEAAGGKLTSVVEALGGAFSGEGELELEEEEFDRIHVVNARFLVGDGLKPNMPGMAWRGRLKDVTGWSIGSIS